VDEKSRFRYTAAVAETALVAIFPELEPLIGEIRCRHTPDGARQMPPHVTLVFPFAGSESVEAYTKQVARVLESFAQFEVTFREPARWPQTLYLKPEPPDPFIAITEALVDAFPDFPPYGGRFDKIIPHVAVAHGDDALLDQLEAHVAPLLGLAVRVERLWLFENGPEAWRRHTAFPLDRRRRV
jgi:2'-5' RNA ligase